MSVSHSWEPSGPVVRGHLGAFRACGAGLGLLGEWPLGPTSGLPPRETPRGRVFPSACSRPQKGLPVLRPPPPSVHRGTLLQTRWPFQLQPLAVRDLGSRLLWGARWALLRQDDGCCGSVVPFITWTVRQGGGALSTGRPGGEQTSPLLAPSPGAAHL